MASSSIKSDITVSEDHFHYSIDDEDLLDNIKPELISFSLSTSYSSHFSSDINTISGVAVLNESEYSHESGDFPSPVDSFTIFLEDPVKTHSSKRTDDSRTDIENSFSYTVPSSLKDISQNLGVDKGIHLNTKQNLAAVVPIDKGVSLNDCEESSRTSLHTLGKEHAFITNTRLSSSLHDLSALPCFPLTSKSHVSLGTVQSQSLMTVSSVPKSKDSGIARSLSCLSLNSGGKMYSHVQSKVKQYIKHIKEESYMNKRQNIAGSSVKQELENAVSTDFEGCHSCHELIYKMKQQLVDKDNMLLETQKMYNSLLIKHAEAKNNIDRLRFKIIDPSIPELPPEVEQFEDLYQTTDSPIIYSKDFNIVAQTFDQCSLKSVSPLSMKMKPCLKSQKINSDESLTSSGTWTDIKAVFEESHMKHFSENQPVNKSIAVVDRSGNPKSVQINSHGTVETTMIPLDKSTIDTIQPTVYEYVSDEQAGYSTEIQNSNEKNITNDVEVTNNVLLCNATAESRTVDKYLPGSKSPVIGTEITNAQKSNSLESLHLKQNADYKLQLNNISNKEQTPFTKDENLLILFSDKSFVENNPFRMNKSQILNEDSFLKVKQWQKSLPPMEMLEPRCYGSLDGNTNESKKASQYYNLGPQVKKYKQMCHSGGDSGYPYSEPCLVYRHKKKVAKHCKADNRQMKLHIASDKQFNEVEHKGTLLQAASEPSSPCHDNLVVNINGIKKHASESCLLMESIPLTQTDTFMFGREPVNAWESLNCLENVNVIENTDSKILQCALIENKKDSAGRNYLPINACECWRDECLPSNAQVNNYSHLAQETLSHNEESISNDCFIPSLKLDDLSGISATIPNAKSVSNDQELIAYRNSNCYERCACFDYRSSHEITYAPSTSISSSAIYSMQSDKHKQSGEEVSIPHKCNYNKMEIQPMQNAYTSFDVNLLNMQGNKKFDISKNISRKNCKGKCGSLISMDTPTSYKSVERHKTARTRAKILSECLDSKTDTNKGEKRDMLFHKVIQSNCNVHNSASMFDPKSSLKHKQIKLTTCKESEVTERKLLGQHTRNILLSLVQNSDTKSQRNCSFINRSSKTVSLSTGSTEKDNSISQDNSSTTVQCISSHPSPHYKEENSNKNEYNDIIMHPLTEHVAEEYVKLGTSSLILSPEDSVLKTAASHSAQKRKQTKMNLMECLDEIDFCAHRIKVHSESIISFLSEKCSNVSPARNVLK